jgi:hypothetical protein
MRNLDFYTVFEGRVTGQCNVVESGEKTSLFFNVAIDNGYKDKNTGEWVDKAKFIECVIVTTNISEARKKYLTGQLIVKGNKVKGIAEAGEPRVDIDASGNPYKDKEGKLRSSVLYFVEDIKLVAKPNSNPIPVDSSQPTIQNQGQGDDLPF